MKLNQSITLDNFKAVVPDDAAPVIADIDSQKVYTRAIYVGVAGDVVGIGRDGTAVTFKAMPVGLHYVGLRIIKATGTTATNIVACF